ncbi:MAG: hypothetical protein SCJ97_03445 [Bacillota bacterium]|nr:hypothetical protein [Bacillota bacterium]
MTEATLQALEGLRDLTTFKWYGSCTLPVILHSGRFRAIRHCERW